MVSLDGQRVPDLVPHRPQWTLNHEDRGTAANGDDGPVEAVEPPEGGCKRPADSDQSHSVEHLPREDPTDLRLEATTDIVVVVVAPQTRNSPNSTEKKEQERRYDQDVLHKTLPPRTHAGTKQNNRKL